MSEFDEVDLGNSCGIKFYKQYITKEITTSPSSSMLLGIWFEYICIGQLPRDKKVPESVILKSGKLSINYQRMQEQSVLFGDIICSNNIKIIETGTVWQYQDIKGILDIYAEIDGKPVIIDIKTSGLIGNKWEKYGWYLPEIQSSSHILQAKFYKYLAWKIKKIEDIPFYFLVHSSKNNYEALFIKVECDNFLEEMEKLQKKIDYTRERINGMIKENSFIPSSDYMECKKCTNKECLFRKSIPNIDKITIY